MTALFNTIVCVGVALGVFALASVGMHVFHALGGL